MNTQASPMISATFQLVATANAPLGVKHLNMPPRVPRRDRIHPRRVLPRVKEGRERDFHSVTRAVSYHLQGAIRATTDDLILTTNTELTGPAQSQLAASVGAERVVAGIDTKNGRIAVKGWKAQVELTADDAIPQLEPHVAAFLYTHVDTEGTMQGFPIDVAARLRKLTAKQLIVAGGIRSQQEIDALDALGADAVVGMAVYTDAIQV